MKLPKLAGMVAILFAVFFSFRPVQADWPLYRGDVRASAVASKEVSLPEKLETVWETRLEKGWFQTTPIVAGKTVYIGSSDEGMQAFSLDDGKILWTFPLELGVLAPAAYFKPASGNSPDDPDKNATKKEFVYFGDTDGILYALDAKTGEERWRFKTKGCIDNSPNIDAETGRVLVGSQDGSLYALNAVTGELAWECKTEDQIRCFPTIAGRRCFIAGCDGKLHVVDLDKGTSVAQVELDAPTGSTPAVYGDRVYFGTEGNEFLAVNWKDAKIAWRHDAGQTFRGPAVCKDGMVVFSGMDRVVRAHDAETGKELWTFRTKGRMEFTGPVIVGDRVYVPSSDSFLYVLDLKTGEKRDAVQLPGKLHGSPAVVDGRILLGTDDGVLCCLGEKR